MRPSFFAMLTTIFFLSMLTIGFGISTLILGVFYAAHISVMRKGWKQANLELLVETDGQVQIPWRWFLANCPDEYHSSRDAAKKYWKKQLLDS